METWIECELYDSIFSCHLFCYILLLLYVFLLNLDLKHVHIQFPLSPYLKCSMSSACALLGQFSAGIAQVLLIFNCSIAIPIPELQYCIAIQNSKTCSALYSTFGLALGWVRPAIVLSYPGAPL